MRFFVLFLVSIFQVAYGGEVQETVTLSGKIVGKQAHVDLGKAPKEYVFVSPGLDNVAVAYTLSKVIPEGRLLYRDLPIEEVMELVEKNGYLSVPYYLMDGTLIGLDEFKGAVYQNIRKWATNSELLKRINETKALTNPMSTLSFLLQEFGQELCALSSRDAMPSVLGLIPVLVAGIHCRLNGKPFAPSLSERHDTHEDYVQAFMSMTLGTADTPMDERRVLTMAKILALHVDHGINASTFSTLVAMSTGADVVSCVSAGIAALSGPKHGGANQEVIEMLKDIQAIQADTDEEKIQIFLKKVEAKEKVAMGFGHRVYKDHDPRAVILEELARSLQSTHPLFTLAQKLKLAAASHPYFTSRNLPPNVDFFSGICYAAYGLNEKVYPLLFALARVGGWLSNMEFNKDQRLLRPAQLSAAVARL